MYVFGCRFFDIKELFNKINTFTINQIMYQIWLMLMVNDEWLVIND